MDPKQAHRDKYEALAQTLGEDSLAGLVADLVPRVRTALASGDENLNTISLATWDRRALGGPDPTKPSKCPCCGAVKSPRAGATLGAADFPQRELRESARDRALPWRHAPTLSLAERVCVLKHVARKLAERAE